MFYLGGDPAQVCNAGGPQALDEVRLREGSLLWPKFPAPLGMRGLTLMRFLAAVNGLINVAGGKAPAAHSAYVISFMRGTYRNDEGELEPFLMSDGIGVGWGARPYADGTDAVYFVAQENYPGRVPRDRLSGAAADLRHPERFLRRRAAIAAAAASCASTTSWPRRPCWPSASTASRTRHGASPAAWRAAPAASSSIPAPTTSACWRRCRDGNVLKRGDVLRIETGGGGGHGHPFDRPTEMVLEDVLGGFVTAEAAQRLYGVAIDSTAWSTKPPRAKLRRQAPGDARRFHRHAYVDSLA